MSTRRFSIFSRLQICFPRHRRRTWIAGSLSTASLCTYGHAGVRRYRENFTITYVCVRRRTLRLAFRLSDGICRVTLYSVCRSSSSAIKLASCTKRFARTICSLNRRRLLTNTTSLTVDRGRIGGFNEAVSLALLSTRNVTELFAPFLSPLSQPALSTRGMTHPSNTEPLHTAVMRLLSRSLMARHRLPRQACGQSVWIQFLAKLLQFRLVHLPLTL